MALSGIIAAEVPGISSIQHASPFPVDEEGNLIISDPYLLAKKQLLDRLFNDKENKDEQKAGIRQTSQPHADTVELSSQAIELQSQTSGKITVKTPDGGTLTVSFDRTEQLRVEATQETQQSDPLILDLNGNGIELTDVTKGNGVRFDSTGDGVKEKVSWVGANDGLLALDRNGNGRIDNGGELFGDQHGAADGFAELAKFDSDGNGVIDNKDDIYASLKVWQDKNGNGISEPNELASLAERGIRSLGYGSDGNHVEVAGNLIAGSSRYGTNRGSFAIGEALLNYYA